MLTAPGLAFFSRALVRITKTALLALVYFLVILGNDFYHRLLPATTIAGAVFFVLMTAHGAGSWSFFVSIVHMFLLINYFQIGFNLSRI